MTSAVLVCTHLQETRQEAIAETLKVQVSRLPSMKRQQQQSNREPCSQHAHELDTVEKEGWSSFARPGVKTQHGRTKA